MAELLQDGLEWLAEGLMQVSSREVTYCRDGAGICRLQAVAGSRPLRQLDAYGATLLSWEYTDWLILAADLVLTGRRVLPEAGDRIEERRTGGKTRVYEVMAPGGEPVYRWCDSDHKHLRIHSKLIETKGVCS